MNVAIVGGTGTVGAEAVRALSSRGHEVRVLVEGTRRLLAVELAAGVRHHVGVSIVGIDRVGGRYYRTKLEQEAEIVRSGVPWTIVRATQFHQLLARVFTASARFGLLPAAQVLVQPVDPSEVGSLLAEMAETEPARAILQFAGPDVVGVNELAQLWRESTGSRGKVTFDRWLASA